MDTDPPLIVPAPPRSTNGRTLALLALVAFVAGLAVMALAFHYRSRWSATTTTTTTQPVVATGAAPSGAVPPAAAAATLDTLAGREAALAARLDALEARTASVGNDAQAASGNAGRAEALLITFAARRALDRGQPLGYVEQQLRLRFGAAQPAEVGAIVQAAREPVTLEDLRAGLDGVAPLLVTGAASDGWLASFGREIGNLVSIHRASAPSTLPVDRLTRARRLIEAGQVEAALAEVARTPGASSAGAWTAAAKRYVAARQALDRLEAVAITGQASPRA